MGEEKELRGLVKFFHIIGKLKEEKRIGWVVKGIKQGESVADHSMRLTLMAMVFGQRENLDVLKLVKMAIIHDIPEAICGDVAVRVKEEMQEIPNREKREIERKALEGEIKLLPAEIAEEIRELWTEFEAGESREARLLYQLDRLEAIFQAVEYEKQGNFEVSLQEFFDYADSRLENRELKAVFGLLMQERKYPKKGQIAP